MDSFKEFAEKRQAQINEDFTDTLRGAGQAAWGAVKGMGNVIGQTASGVASGVRSGLQNTQQGIQQGMVTANGPAVKHKQAIVSLTQFVNSLKQNPALFQQANSVLTALNTLGPAIGDYNQRLAGTQQTPQQAVPMSVAS